MDILDITSSNVIIKFTKGTTFNPLFSCITADNQPVDLTGFTAKMMAKLTPESDYLTGWNLTTENGGLSIEQNSIDVYCDTILTYGIRVNVPPSVTSVADWSRAIFGVTLIAPLATSETTPVVMDFLKGRLHAEMEIVI